jgi:hypothetical protein
VELAATAAFLATLTAPAARPDWLKHASPVFSCPLPSTSHWAPLLSQSDKPTLPPSLDIHLALAAFTNLPFENDHTSLPVPDVTAALQLLKITEGPAETTHISSAEEMPAASIKDGFVLVTAATSGENEIKKHKAQRIMAGWCRRHTTKMAYSTWKICYTRVGCRINHHHMSS